MVHLTLLSSAILSFSCRKQSDADLVNLFHVTPAAIRAEDNKYIQSKMTTTMQTKIPQAADVGCRESFNDKTRKSLLKINLFIRRLKWFNIFNDTTKTTKATTNAPSKTDINPKW